MDKVKILVACHKPAKVYQDDVYTPIQVGKALHPDLDLGYITDDTGDNISEENPYYCELTAIYWGWKNLNCEYIGLQHYRRYFNFIFNENNIDNVFKDCDVVLATPLWSGESVFKNWMAGLIPEDVYVAFKLLEAMYPDDYEKGKAFFSNPFFYPCNMFVCKKSLLDEFAKWEFPYLKKLKEVLKLSGYSREKRILGYIGEGLLPLYFLNRGYRIKTMDIVPFPNDTHILLRSDLKAKMKSIYRHIISKKSIVYDDTILAGLRQDKLLDSENRIIL